MSLLLQKKNSKSTSLPELFCRMAIFTTIMERPIESMHFEWLNGCLLGTLTLNRCISGTSSSFEGFPATQCIGKIASKQITLECGFWNACSISGCKQQSTFIFRIEGSASTVVGELLVTMCCVRCKCMCRGGAMCAPTPTASFGAPTPAAPAPTRASGSTAPR